jgi:NADH dehydrogenase FAD-containing subunit
MNCHSNRPPRIVIVGGGFGGAYCAQALERRLRPGAAEVVLIDCYNYFIFYPLLIEAGSGSLEPRHAVVSIRDYGTVDDQAERSAEANPSLKINGEDMK